MLKMMGGNPGGHEHPHADHGHATPRHA